MTRSGSASSAGFTLVELLVALTLLGFMSLILLGGLRFGMHAWHRAQELSDATTDVRAAGAAVERLLGQAQVAYASTDPGDRTIDFVGSADAVTLVAPLPDAIDPGIMARQHLSLVPTVNGSGLALLWQLDTPSSLPKRPAPASAILLDNVRSLRLRYWGARPPDEQKVWQDDWQERPQLPELISVDIRRGNNTALGFTVALPVTSSPACRYYSVGPMCQRSR